MQIEAHWGTVLPSYTEQINAGNLIGLLTKSRFFRTPVDIMHLKVLFCYITTANQKRKLFLHDVLVEQAQTPNHSTINRKLRKLPQCLTSSKKITSNL